MLRSENEIVFPFEKCIIFTVVPFVDYLSHLGRGLYNVVYNLCPIPLSFCNKICLIYLLTRPRILLLIWSHVFLLQNCIF